MARINERDIGSVVDHGMFRGKRTWTVTIEHGGRSNAVNVTDVDSVGKAIGKAITILQGAPEITAEAREAMRQQSDAINHELAQ